MSSHTSNGSPWTAVFNTEGQADPDTEPQKMTSSVPAISFSSAGKELLETGKYADAKIVGYDGKIYNVHKSMLCPRSKWFQIAFKSSFRESWEGVVNITSPDNIDRLLEFLYTGAVDLTETKEADLMEAANDIFYLGAFYLSDEMKTHATQVLGQYLGEVLNSICDFEQWSVKPPQYTSTEYRRPILYYKTTIDSCRRRKFKLLEEEGFIDRLCVAIRSAYARPTGIHRVYVDFVYAARVHTFKNASIQALKDEIPQFGLDILSALMTEPPSPAFEGNRAFEQWKDGLFNAEVVTKVRPLPSQTAQPPVTVNGVNTNQPRPYILRLLP